MTSSLRKPKAARWWAMSAECAVGTECSQKSVQVGFDFQGRVIEPLDLETARERDNLDGDDVKIKVGAKVAPFPLLFQLPKHALVGFVDALASPVMRGMASLMRLAEEGDFEADESGDVCVAADEFAQCTQQATFRKNALKERAFPLGLCSKNGEQQILGCREVVAQSRMAHPQRFGDFTQRVPLEAVGCEEIQCSVHE